VAGFLSGLRQHQFFNMYDVDPPSPVSLLKTINYTVHRNGQVVLISLTDPQATSLPDG
jgi:hypothetical protein